MSNEDLGTTIEDLRSRIQELGIINAELDKRRLASDEFLATLGHELRHPLTPIAHAIYMLRRGNPDPTTAELIEAIDRQTQRLSRFVNELMDVARIGRGLIEIRRERLEFVDVVRQAIQAIQPLLEQRHHTLTISLPGAPVYVSGDADRLNQVVNNLMENAAKYTDPGGQIMVTLEQINDEVVLRVRDNGIGIASENLASVFEPFTQSHGAFAGARPGLGLGLSIARRMMELHGGRVAATSAGLAMGSEFVASLPVLAANEEHRPQVQSPMRDPPPLSTLRTRRVLIVDDHEEVGQSVARIVRRWGHEVAIVKDGPTALTLAETFHPECAILDLSLPGMSGIVLARQLRKVFPPERLYLIALTGNADADVRAECIGEGFDEYLVKSGEIKRLERLLGAEMKGQSSVRMTLTGNMTNVAVR
jgi:two-component system CheB/CheR fusion protein